MKLIKADHDRRLEIPGVPGLARRPVDIDRSRTGFTNLRSLRIYRFDAQSVINGHAEEDEVFVVVMAGSVELNVSEANSPGGPHSFLLSAAGASGNLPCVAYLPPDSAYQLIPQTDADVAYARATPVGCRASTVFAPRPRGGAVGVTALLEETTYARRLRVRLVQIDASQDNVVFKPVQESESLCEALVHVRTAPAEGVATITTFGAGPTELNSWDTASVAPGDHPALCVASQSSALVLVVLAV